MNEPTKKPSFERYASTQGGFSNSDLKRATFFARHRTLVRTVVIGVSSVVAGGLFVYGIFGITSYAFFGAAHDRQLGNELAQLSINYAQLHSRYAPQDLRVLNADVYQSVPNRFDFVSTVANDNPRFVARIVYHFSYGNGETEQKETILLPKTERPLAIVGHKSDQIPGPASFVVDEIRWRQVDPHEIAAVDEYMASRLKFSVTDFLFTPQNASLNLPSNSIAFTLANTSAFGYWDVPLMVELLQNGVRVGVTETTLHQFKAGEKRPLDIRTVTPNISVSDIRVHPLINIFSRDVFMPPEAI